MNRGLLGWVGSLVVIFALGYYWLEMAGNKVTAKEHAIAAGRMT